eukprot:1195304-Prorocentrum_minimum.AAC.4
MEVFDLFLSQVQPASRPALKNPPCPSGFRLGGVHPLALGFHLRGDATHGDCPLYGGAGQCCKLRGEPQTLKRYGY